MPQISRLFYPIRLAKRHGWNLVFVDDPKGHVGRRDMFLGGLDMNLLIIEKDVRAKCLEKFALGAPAQEKRFVNPDSPFAQGQHHPLVRRRRAGGNQGCSNRVVIGGIG